MADFELVVQQTIYDTLTGLISTPVYDDVPQPNDTGEIIDFPYVTIGEDVHTYNDTDLNESNSVSITIHTWSRKRGRKEIKTIQASIRNSLHNADLVASGYRFVIITQQSSTSFMDPDGVTRHGVQTFNLIIEED